MSPKPSSGGHVCQLGHPLLKFLQFGLPTIDQASKQMTARAHANRAFSYTVLWMLNEFHHNSSQLYQCLHYSYVACHSVLYNSACVALSFSIGPARACHNSPSKPNLLQERRLLVAAQHYHALYSISASCVSAGATPPKA